MSLCRTHLTYLFTAGIAAAQTFAPPPAAHVHDEPVALENLVVTASMYGRNQADITQPTSVLAGRELYLRQAPTLGELLSGQPGVSSTYFGPGASRPIIRGLGGDRLRVLENGLGSIDASVTSPDHAVSLDPLLIERVEVVRGPSALLYGGNAVGGVVNVITHRIHPALPDHPFQGRVEVRGGTGDDSVSTGLVLEGAAGRLAWHADGYVRDTGDVSIPGFAESTRRRAAEAEEAAEHGEAPPEEIAGTIPNTALRNEGGAFGLSYIGSRGHVGFAVSRHDSLYGVPAGAHEHAHHEDAGEEDHDAEEPDHAEESVRVDLRQRRFDLQGEITEPFGLFRGARFKLGTARYRHAELEGDTVGTEFRNRGYDGRIELMHQPVGRFTGAFGWQGGRSDFEAYGEEAFIPPSRTDTHALFALEEIEFQPGTWQVGARIERQKIDLRDGSGIKRDDDQISFSTGFTHNYGADWTLGASLAGTQRAPNAQELFAQGPHVATNAYEIGDPALRQEKSVAVDVTLRKRTGLVTGAFTLFANRFSGFVFEEPTGQVAVEHDGVWEFHDAASAGAEGGVDVYRFVQRDARFHGAELETIIHLHAGDGRQLDFLLGADFVRGRNRSDAANLPRITPLRTKAGLAWRRGALALGGEVQFVARQTHTAPDETPSAAYELISAYANYRLSSGKLGWDVFIRGTNLGDREARLHSSFLKEVAPLPGRNVTAGVRLTF